MSLDSRHSRTSPKTHEKRPSMPKISEQRTWLADDQIEIPTTDIVTYAFEECGKYNLDKPIFVDAFNLEQAISASSARQIVRRFVGGFREQGVREGVCVCLHSYNNVFYPLLCLGAIGAGGCVSGSNPAYTVSELAHHLRITSTQFIVAHIDCFARIAEAARECQIPQSHIFVQGSPDQRPPDGYQSWERLLSGRDCDWVNFGEDHEKSLNTTAILGATSGTTGKPKAAAISHRFLVAQCEMINRYNKARKYPLSRLICLPVFHGFAGPIGLILPLRQGSTTYFMPRFKIEKFVDAIHALSVTEGYVVPPIITALLKLKPSKPKYLRSLQYIVCAGASMSPDAQTRLYHQLAPTAVIGQCWGTTEAGWITAFDSCERDTAGSVGRLLPSVELKVVTEDGHSVVKDGARGEGYIRSPSMFSGYCDSPGANANAFDADGFYRTGDQVYVEDGKVFIDGRIKEIIKVRGWQVSPAELEEILLQHPGIEDAAVGGFTRQSEEGIEEILPRAFIVRGFQGLRGKEVGKYVTPPESPASGTSHCLTEQEIQEYIALKVVTYKHLTGGVVFVDKIPRSNTGKILRKLLDKVAREVDRVKAGELLSQSWSSPIFET